MIAGNLSGLLLWLLVKDLVSLTIDAARLVCFNVEQRLGLSRVIDLTVGFWAILSLTSVSFAPFYPLKAERPTTQICLMTDKSIMPRFNKTILPANIF